MSYNIVIIDDDLNMQRSIAMFCTSTNYEVTTFADPIKALSFVKNTCVDVMVIDICLSKTSGIEFYKELQAMGYDIPTIFMSGRASLSEAAQCMKLGAFDFLEKPFSGEKLLFSLKNCIDQRQLKSLVEELQSKRQNEDILGEHPSIVVLRREIEKVAKVDSVVLICGESGSGKEIIAQSIRKQSKRAAEAFITVNCSAIPESLHESALFGHVKGAFTGAESHKKGYFETAHRGTIFLDEIADMSLAAQASLLRVLENKEIQKVGSDEITKVDVRVIAATHKNLKDQVANDLFRADLFYRISVIPLDAPSLRDRVSDIPLLVSHLMINICKQHGLPLKAIETDCLRVLQDYDWPGNVRELINTLERMIIMGGETLSLDDIPFDIKTSGGGNSALMDEKIPLKLFKRKMERQYLVHQLKLHDGNISLLAKTLDIDRVYLHKKLADHDIKRKNFFS